MLGSSRGRGNKGCGGYWPCLTGAFFSCSRAGQGRAGQKIIYAAVLNCMVCVWEGVEGGRTLAASHETLSSISVVVMMTTRGGMNGRVLTCRCQT